MSRRGLSFLFLAFAFACADPVEQSPATYDACAELPEITHVVGASHEVIVYEAADGNRYTVKDKGRIVSACVSSDDLPGSVPDSARTVVRMLERPDFGYVQ